MKREWIEQAKKCADLHAKWYRWDRHWDRMISMFMLFTSTMFLFASIREILIGQIIWLLNFTAVLIWSRKHIASHKWTQEFLEQRDECLKEAYDIWK